MNGDICVRVELHGELRAKLPDHRPDEPVTLRNGATIHDLLLLLGARGETWLVAVNGQVASLERELGDGEVIDLFPALEGG